MFFTECANLADRHPDLASAIQRIDSQLGKMRTAEVIRVDVLSSFLGLDPNQTSAVLEGLAGAGVLVAEEMVECAHCGMVVLRSDYDEVLEEEDEYRCTSCDRLWEDGRVRAVTTYRRGEKWPEPLLDLAHAEQLIGPAEEYPKEHRVFKNQGKTWLVVYEGVPKSVGHSIGMTYICSLLQSPGREAHAITLRSLVMNKGDLLLSSSGGEMLDYKALKEYRERLRDIEEELREAESNNDLARKVPLKEELEALTAEIGRATGLSGRKRTGTDDRERARQAVSRAIYRALDAIKKEHEPLWQHLNNSLKIGGFLSYSPDRSVSWTT